MNAIKTFLTRKLSKRAEALLRESEEKYRQLFELESDALFLIDAESGTFLDANAAAVSLYGYTRDELLGMRNTDLSAEPSETLKAATNASVDGISVIPIRYHRKKDGTIFPVEIKATSLLWRGRRCLIPAIRDITDRKRIGDKLQASETRYRALMEQSFEALAVVDILTREVVEVNSQFTRLLGYSLPEDAPLTVDRYAMDSKEELDFRYDITLPHHRALPMETKQLRHKNGTLIYVERAGTVVSIEGRDYLLSSMRDMTVERQRQAEMGRDIELARKVQRELLPELAASPFVDVQTLYYPSNMVSGDSYHLEWRQNGQLLRGFLLDVSGHGMATALQTASIISLLREGSIAQMPLNNQIQWINRRAAKYFVEGTYVAMLGIELDLQAKELRYVGAGITQFFVNGQKIDTPGMFVGMWPDAEFSVSAMPISVGDTFCFLTDGFTDVLAQPEDAGMVVTEARDFDAHVATLKQLAESGVLRDDATGLCLKVKEIPRDTP